jgi:hypothetical protein
MHGEYEIRFERRGWAYTVTDDMHNPPRGGQPETQFEIVVDFILF